MSQHDKENYVADLDCLLVNQCKIRHNLWTCSQRNIGQVYFPGTGSVTVFPPVTVNPLTSETNWLK